MTDVVVHLSNVASRHGRIAHAMRRLLDELPDAALNDIGLARSDIPFIVGKLVYRYKDPAGDAIDRFDWKAVWRNATILRLPDAVFRLAIMAVAAVSAIFVLSSAVLT